MEQKYLDERGRVAARGGNGCEVDRVVGSERFTRKEDPVRTAILLIPLALVACEGSGSTSASSVVTLQPGGANPTAISVMGGAQLEFVNADSMDIKSPRAIARS